MRINVISADRLTPEHVAIWSQIQCAEATLDSPFFRPEFTQAVASVRRDVEVAVMEEDGEAVGFFPYQRNPRNVAIPVGGVLSDFQGVIVRQGIEWDAERLIRACGLRAWHFNHLVASQTPFQRFHLVMADSPYMDLSEGFEAYQQQRRRAGAKPFHDIPRKMRKLVREAGPLRFEPQTRDRYVFEKLVEWKVQQYRHTKVCNYLGPQWTIALLEKIVQSDGKEFSGWLSAVYAGDHLVAAHLGLRSAGTLHGWFPAYDPAFSKYSPGIILCAELARAAQPLGIQRLNMGRGSEHYKISLKSGAIPLAEGSVGLRPVHRALRQTWLRTRDWARSSRLRAPAQCLVRNTRVWLGCHDYANPLQKP